MKQDLAALEEDRQHRAELISRHKQLLSPVGSVSQDKKLNLETFRTMDSETHAEKLNSLLSGPRNPVSSLPEDVLHSNDTTHIPESQFSAIRQIVVSGETSVEILNKEVENLDQQISDLTLRRSACREVQQNLSLHIERHRSLFSPARRIPGDIWSYIFELATKNDIPVNLLSNIGWGRFTKPFDSTRAPLVLTQVCRTWRELAIYHTPLIWATIQLHYNGCKSMSSQLASKNDLLLLQEFLIRSRDVPMTVDVILEDISSDPTHIHNDILALLWIESWRWQTVSIFQVIHYFEDDDATDALFPITYSTFRPNKLDNVDRLKLRLDSVPLQSLFDAQISPQCLSLKITSNPAARSILDASTLQWSRIMSLELDIHSMLVLDADGTAAIVGVICQCSGIERLVVSCLVPDDEVALNGMQLVHLARLKSVKWKYEGSTLAKLEAPQLENAELEWGEHSAVFLRTAKNLKLLTLDNTNSHRFLLASCPFTILERLEMTEFMWKAEDVESFAGVLDKLSKPLNNSDDVLFPSLKHIQLTLHMPCWNRPALYLLQASILAFCRQAALPHSHLTHVPHLESFWLEVPLKLSSQEDEVEEEEYFENEDHLDWYKSLLQLKQYAPACLKVVLE